MTLSFWQLVGIVAALVGVLLVFALTLMILFVWFLNGFLKATATKDRERSESCHNFQRELNKQTLIGFNKNYEALSLCTQALNAFMERNAPPPEPLKDSPKGT